MIVDVATQPSGSRLKVCGPQQRPVEKQEKAYNGQKRHISKSQISINEKNGKILHCQLEKQGLTLT